MNLEQIKQRIEDIFELYDNAISEYASARADYIFWDKEPNVVKDEVASRDEYKNLSEAARQRIAGCSQEYKNARIKQKEVNLQYFTAHENLDKFKSFLDALRSMGAWERDIINKGM